MLGDTDVCRCPPLCRPSHMLCFTHTPLLTLTHPYPPSPILTHPYPPSLNPIIFRPLVVVPHTLLSHLLISHSTRTNPKCTSIHISLQTPSAMGNDPPPSTFTPRPHLIRPTFCNPPSTTHLLQPTFYNRACVPLYQGNTTTCRWSR